MLGERVRATTAGDLVTAAGWGDGTGRGGGERWSARAKSSSLATSRHLRHLLCTDSLASWSILVNLREYATSSQEAGDPKDPTGGSQLSCSGPLRGRFPGWATSCGFYGKGRSLGLAGEGFVTGVPSSAVPKPPSAGTLLASLTSPTPLWCSSPSVSLNWLCGLQLGSTYIYSTAGFRFPCRWYPGWCPGL